MDIHECEDLVRRTINATTYAGYISLFRSFREQAQGTGNSDRRRMEVLGMARILICSVGHNYRVQRAMIPYRPWGDERKGDAINRNLDKLSDVLVKIAPRLGDGCGSNRDFLRDGSAFAECLEAVEGRNEDSLISKLLHLLSGGWSPIYDTRARTTLSAMYPGQVPCLSNSREPGRDWQRFVERCDDAQEVLRYVCKDTFRDSTMPDGYVLFSDLGYGYHHLDRFLYGFGASRDLAKEFVDLCNRRLSRDCHLGQKASLQSMEILPSPATAKIFHLRSNDSATKDSIDHLCLYVGLNLKWIIEWPNGKVLLSGIIEVRKRIPDKFGWFMPRVFFQFDPKQSQDRYQICLNRSVVGEGEIVKNMMLALYMSDQPPVGVTGVRCHEPVFGQDSLWIPPSHADIASQQGCFVVGPTMIIITHLEKIILDRLAKPS